MSHVDPTAEELRFAAAERWLGDWLAERDSDRTPRHVANDTANESVSRAESFEALVAQHPECAAELRALGRQIADVEQAFEAEARLAYRERVRSATLLQALASPITFSDRYAIETEIGRGGMGAILRVVDKRLHRTLAMKVIAGQAAPDATGLTPPVPAYRLARFLVEARITSQLDHPGIVPVHEIGVDKEQRAYFTMKLVKGLTLTELFSRRAAGDPKWTTARVLDVIQRVCEAVAFAHDRHVIHRDLKPANVMVGDFGEVYVMDWGLARKLDDTPEDTDAAAAVEDRFGEQITLTREGNVVGTPAYMPPEQARGALDEVGPTADVYAIGAMLYQLIAGFPPYFANADEKVAGDEIVSRIKAAPAAKLRTPGTPPELVAICEKAMAYEAGARYANVSELAADLRRFLERRVVRAYASGAWAEARKWVARNRALAAALAAVFFVLLGGSSYIAWERDTHSSEIAGKNVELSLRNSELAQTTAKAQAAQQDAEGRLAEVKRLADIKRVRDLEERAADLWPAWPALVPEMEQWIRDAEELTGRLPLHERSRDEIRTRTPLADAAASAGSFTETRRRRAYEERGRELDLLESSLQQRLDETEAALRTVSDDDERRSLEFDTKSLPNHRILLAEERQARSSAQAWRFADAEAQWWHDQLGELIDSLKRLNSTRTLAEKVPLAWKFLAETESSVAAALAVSDATDTIHAMRGRVAHARWVHELTIVAAGEAWDQAIDRVARHPKYAGLKLARQVGLVPIGPDPGSGLEEFSDLETGAIAVRDTADGRIKMTNETGLVFVLLPGATFDLGSRRPDDQHPAGSPNVDPEMRAASDGPVRTVTLAPFFISKFEMTQAQWIRVTGSNPSFFSVTGLGVPFRLTCPVEQVSWIDGHAVLSRLGLAFPTDAQWEFAARGGTTTIWWVGDSKEALATTANLADQSFLRYATQNTMSAEDWDDHFGQTAPVGTFRANGFGLHDVIGNVSEWCEEPCIGCRSRPAPLTGDGRACIPLFPADHERIVRGGSFLTNSISGKSADRGLAKAASEVVEIGLRPARAINE